MVPQYVCYRELGIFSFYKVITVEALALEGVMHSVVLLLSEGHGYPEAVPDRRVG